MRTSCDTNIATYAFADFRDPEKTRKSRDLLFRLFADPDFFISTQLLKEFANVATKKLKPPLPHDLLLDRLNNLSELRVVVVDTPIILAAANLHYSAYISFFDALQVEAARAGGADILYSEDNQHGRKFGSVQIVNPLL